jgi:AcrR family transcriptional regulator
MASGNRGKPRPDRPDDLGALSDLVADKVAASLTKKIAKYDQLSKKAAYKAQVIERAAQQIGDALEVWTRSQPPTRRPRFTRDDICAAALRIADTEGFEAVSMRRIANELGAGTMTLYHYVRTKDELLALLMDAVMAEIVVPENETLPSDWRAALTLLAVRARDSLRRHSWILDITDDPALGPNSVRHFDQSLGAVDALPISLDEKFDIVFTLDDFVFGYCLRERNDLASDATSPREMIDYVKSLINDGGYPSLSNLADTVGIETAWQQLEAHLRDDDRFDRNLSRILDGFAANLPR